MPRAFREHVHDQAAVKSRSIQSLPALAFPVLQADAAPFQAFFNFVANGSELARAESCAQNKIIGKRGEAFQIEQDNISRLLFLRGGDGRANMKRNGVFS